MQFYLLFVLSSVLVQVKCSLYNDFGILKIFESVDESSDFYSNFAQSIANRSWDAVAVDPGNPICWARGGSASFEVDSDTGVLSMSGNTPRYYCYINHTNVEFTAYGKRGSETQTSTTQGLVLVARSNHKSYASNFCNAQSYYFRYYNSGKVCFLKEFIHSSNCLVYASGNPCADIDAGGPVAGQWYGIKVVIANQNDGDVNLLAYLDTTDGVDGGDWQLVLNYTDTVPSTWLADVVAGEEGCMENCSYSGDEAWTDEATCVFLRASYVTDYEWKKMSLREIVPNVRAEADTTTDSPTMTATSTATGDDGGVTTQEPDETEEEEEGGDSGANGMNSAVMLGVVGISCFLSLFWAL